MPGCPTDATRTPPPPPPPPSPTPLERHAGVRALRRHHSGTLQHYERVTQVKLVIEAASGQIVMPVEPAFASAGESMLLWLPAENDWDAQVALIPRPIDRPESVESVDRWGAYHGTTSLTTWVRCEIEGLKTELGVFGDEAQLANPLGRGEYALIKAANADRERLAAACKKYAAMPVADPLCVGADPFGLDVKARFGIIRLEFADGIEAATPEQCQREIARLLGQAGGGGPH